MIKVASFIKFKNFSKKWLKEYKIEIYPTCNESKYVVDKRFIRTLNNKVYKHMTVVSKMFIADKYNNTYRNTIKMKSIDVTPTSFAEKKY